MRVEYIIVSFVILLIVLLIALAMLGGVGEGFKFIAGLFSKTMPK